MPCAGTRQTDSGSGSGCGTIRSALMGAALARGIDSRAVGSLSSNPRANRTQMRMPTCDETNQLSTGRRAGDALLSHGSPQTDRHQLTSSQSIPIPIPISNSSQK